MIRIGIDLGGTKIAGIAIGGDEEILAVARIPTPRGDYTGSISAIRAMVHELAETAGSSDFTVGIGIPGSVSPLTGRVQNANSTWINGQHFQNDIELALGCSVRLANDANCLAVSEAYDGAGSDATSIYVANSNVYQESVLRIPWQHADDERISRIQTSGGAWQRDIAVGG